ncbi:hypothetical protein BP5796_13136 [Coleophoma crateriformis]|uniref:Subtilisin-like serine protease n=1 Tax=Coleophoma crateriformis TaxID=565419 RepID=A0A3D8Q3N5_9HELO|nr:hypothetical protein BP5796_13136 [Coleophoma crateriformis]
MSTSNSPDAPFPVKDALCTQRLGTPNSHSADPRPLPASPPTNIDGEPLSYVPGEPRVKLASADVQAFLARELHTPLLDNLYRRLWLVGRRDGGNIDSLHRQKNKGRHIVPTEDPKLHPVWHHDKIYIKPIPRCLLNRTFWTDYLCRSSTNQTTPPSKLSSLAEEEERWGVAQQSDYTVATGFLRSYAYLVSHYSDFQIARETHLLPDDIDWIKWSMFIAHFGTMEDRQVARRYHYGQLRLSRLNWAVRIFQPQGKSTSWFYEIPYWNTYSYLQRAIAPLAFAFASISIVLSSMQVILSVPADGLGFGQLDDGFSLQAIRRAFWVFSVIVLLLSGAIWTLMLVIPLGVLVWQLLWGFRHRG